jgi:hypothetical protein
MLALSRVQGQPYVDMLLIGDLSGAIPMQQVTNNAFAGGYAIVSLAGCVVALAAGSLSLAHTLHFTVMRFVL